LPVLAATLTTAVVFFPVTFLYGVSRFLFTSLALTVVISLFASYVVALTVVPLYCSRFLTAHSAHTAHPGSGNWAEKFNYGFNLLFERFLNLYSTTLTGVMRAPALTIAAVMGLFLVSLLLYPKLGVAFFPRTDAGQFIINMKAPSGTRLELTNQEVERVEGAIRAEIPPEELEIIVANIGVQPGFSAIYTSNSAQHTAFVQVSLKEGHKVSTFDYMDKVRARVSRELPHLTTFFQTGGLVDAVLNLGLPAPIDVQISGSNLMAAGQLAAELQEKIRGVPGISDVYMPQDLDYPAFRLEVDRTLAGQLGLSQREVISNVITALSSNQMIAPSYWVDRRSGNDYMLTVQYPENTVKDMVGLKSILLRSPRNPNPTRLEAVTSIKRTIAPTMLTHYQIRRVLDLYVTTKGEDLGEAAGAIEKIIAETKVPAGLRIDLRGMVQGMNQSFKSFGLGLLLSLVLLYLVLVAQFRSFVDPILILLAVPTGLTGVLVFLYLWGTTLNVMSLMGVVMMAGIVVSNSILIVDFAHTLRQEGKEWDRALELACRTRLRPILMTSLATIIGLIPMALKLGEGSESYAPLAQAIIGGLTVSVVFTVFLVPAAMKLVYGRRKEQQA